MSRTEESGYNPIFEQLVASNGSEPESLPGMVAYSLYKISKREWTTRHFERTGRRPTSEELEAYIATWTPSRLNGLAEQGNSVLLAFTEQVIEQNRPAIREEALRGSFGRSVLQGIVAAAAYTVLLIAVALMLKIAGIDLLSTLQSVGHPSAPAAQTATPNQS